MANHYRVRAAPRGWPETLPFRLGVPGQDKDYGIGDEFEHEFTLDDERANLDSGLLEIVPRTYKVVGDTAVYETPPGGEFEAALDIFEEAHLVGAGHIVRVEEKTIPTKRTKKEAS